MSDSKNIKAFPRGGYVIPQDIDADQWMKGQEGMTLRDYFAANAMQGILSSTTTKPNSQLIAEWAYNLADAMLEEREIEK